MDSSSLSSEDLRDLIDVLRQPLDDRPVLVPLTSKAFVRGRLTPENDTVSLGTPKGLQVMTREQARECLQAEMKAQIPKKQSSVLKSPPGGSATNTSSESDNSQQHQQSSSLPFLEIREEIDDEGNSVRSEVADVTKQLQELEGAAEAPAGNPIAASQLNTVEKPFGHDEVQLRPLDDVEYDRLAARLEELARLEEADAVNKKTNAASRTQLQSKGWASGFLNKSRKKRTPSKETVPKLRPPPSSAATADSVSSTDSRPKTVGFADDTNDVREIPRIGERSVREVQRPPNRPLEREIFSGMVHERTASNAKTVTPVMEAGTEAQPKKLSRFAQERLQLR